MANQINQEIVELVIKFDQKTGQTQITGPIDNRMLCYGMLATAHEIIFKRGFSVEVKQGNIVVPQLRIDPNGRR